MHIGDGGRRREGGREEEGGRRKRKRESTLLYQSQCCRKKKYARELELSTVSPSTKPATTDSDANTLSDSSPEVANRTSTDIPLVTNDAYDQLPALARTRISTDNDYDQLPAMVNKSGLRE